jgi:hypothetical protein
MIKPFLGIFVCGLILAVIWLAIDWSNEHGMRIRADAHIREILSFLDLASLPSFHQRLDKLRTFINDNSVHKIDKTFQINQKNPDAFLAGLLAHAKGTTAEPVHMECSTRTGAMARILKAFGYETRVIAIFNSKTNLRSHTLLEVMNPDTQRWETQDADYDIYWRSKSSGQRLSLADSAQLIEDIEPCGRNGCGWGASKEGRKAKKLIDYLDIVSVTAKDKELRFGLYTTRADISRSYTKGYKQGTFCEVEPKRCKDGFYDITKYSTYELGLPR